MSEYQTVTEATSSDGKIFITHGEGCVGELINYTEVGDVLKGTCSECGRYVQVLEEDTEL